MDADQVVARLLELGKTRRPASAGLVDRVLREVGLPDAPTYRALLAQSDGLTIGNVDVYGVKKLPALKYIGFWLDVEPPLIPIAMSGSFYYGWDSERRCWTRPRFIPDVTFPDDLSLFLDLAHRSIRGFFGPVPVVAAPVRSVRPLREVLELVERDPYYTLRAPRSVRVRERAARRFERVTGHVMPADYVELLSVCDGFSVNGFVMESAVDVAVDDDGDGVALVGQLDDQWVVFDGNAGQWQVVEPGDDDPDAEDRYSTVTDLVGTLVPERLA